MKLQILGIVENTVIGSTILTLESVNGETGDGQHIQWRVRETDREINKTVMIATGTTALHVGAIFYRSLVNHHKVAHAAVTGLFSA